MVTDEHPIDPLLMQLEGVRRVLGPDAQESSADEPLKVTAIFVATLGPPQPTVLACDLDLVFVSGGVRFKCPDYMPRQVRDFITPTLQIDSIEPQPLYVIGAERCECLPQEGGPLWNPLCVALKWAPVLGPEAIQWLVPKWMDVIRSQQDQFCRGGISLMRGFGLV